MVRRTRAASFFGGAYVFPGGRVDAADQDAGLIARCDGVETVAARLPDLSAAEAAAYAVAALRELFEEAGVLVARDAQGRPVRTDTDRARERFDAHRLALCGGQQNLGAMLEAEGLRLALDHLQPFAHWITPVNEPKRFDTRFFVARMPDGQQPMHDAGETTDTQWVAPGEALERFARDEIVLAPPTWSTLHDLARLKGADAMLAWAATQPMPAIEPRPHEQDGRKVLLLPGDPLNPADWAPPIDHTRFVLDHTGRWRAENA